MRYIDTIKGEPFAEPFGWLHVTRNLLCHIYDIEHKYLVDRGSSSALDVAASRLQYVYIAGRSELLKVLSIDEIFQLCKIIGHSSFLKDCDMAGGGYDDMLYEVQSKVNEKDLDNVATCAYLKLKTLNQIQRIALLDIMEQYAFVGGDSSQKFSFIEKLCSDLDQKMRPNRGQALQKEDANNEHLDIFKLRWYKKPNPWGIDDNHGLEFVSPLGLIGYASPIRPGLREAINYCLFDELRSEQLIMAGSWKEFAKLSRKNKRVAEHIDSILIEDVLPKYQDIVKRAKDELQVDPARYQIELALEEMKNN